MTIDAVAVVGLGLIGGSVALALRAAGLHVAGSDRDGETVQRALRAGVIDAADDPYDVDLVVVATPVGAIPAVVADVLDRGRGLVTDVGSVKGPMLELMTEPRYVGGHPMAGSDRDGLDGARGDLFAGMTWVLTPTPDTPDSALAEVGGVVRLTGAEVVAVDPGQHDEMVAAISHVPRLVASTIMRLAGEQALDDPRLLALAGGGFRDLTRIAGGRTGIWGDICAANRDPIVAELDRVIDALLDVRRSVAAGASDAVVEHLELGRAARRLLPVRARVGAPSA